MGQIVFVVLLILPFAILAGILHSWLSVKHRKRYLHILNQQIEELELRVVNYKSEKNYSILGLLHVAFPFEIIEEELRISQNYYLVLSPHIEIRVSEAEYIKFSGKRFVKVIKQKLDVKDTSPWYLNPWLFTLFNPEYSKATTEIITYRLI